jgi:hypothetical protein
MILYINAPCCDVRRVDWTNSHRGSRRAARIFWKKKYLRVAFVVFAVVVVVVAVVGLGGFKFQAHTITDPSPRGR